MDELAARLRSLESEGKLTLPLPGSGSTARRHDALFELGRLDLSVARLAEAHTDALAVLVESGRSAPRGRLYGVWASDGPGSLLKLSRGGGNAIVLSGTKRYCTGAPVLNAALVTAHESVDGTDMLLLIEVPLDSPGITIDLSAWAAPAFAATGTATVSFEDVRVGAGAVVGAPGWYLSRPGFWHGAVGPAACWAGGAAGLIDAARTLNKRDPHARAQLGALESAEWGLRAILNQAALEIDADPADASRQAQRRALMARHLIERICTDVLDRFGRATGPQLLAFDSSIAQRTAELALYIRQCHGDRDLAAIPAD